MFGILDFRNEWLGSSKLNGQAEKSESFPPSASC